MILNSTNINDITLLITPYLPFLGVVAGAILVGIFSLWNRKRGAVETRAPDVNEIWVQQANQSKELDMERKARRRLENLYYDIRRAFLSYVRRVQSGGSMELTSAEKHIIESDLQTGDHRIIEEN